jgi:hypothetical protein
VENCLLQRDYIYDNDAATAAKDAATAKNNDISMPLRDKNTHSLQKHTALLWEHYKQNSNFMSDLAGLIYQQDQTNADTNTYFYELYPNYMTHPDFEIVISDKRVTIQLKGNY